MKLLKEKAYERVFGWTAGILWLIQLPIMGYLFHKWLPEEKGKDALWAVIMTLWTLPIGIWIAGLITIGFMHLFFKEVE